MVFLAPPLAKLPIQYFQIVDKRSIASWPANLQGRNPPITKKPLPAGGSRHLAALPGAAADWDSMYWRVVGPLASVGRADETKNLC